jgi:hypothetical protein
MIAVFMLKNVAMVHKNTGIREPVTDFDFFAQINEKRIYKAAREAPGRLNPGVIYNY